MPEKPQQQTLSVRITESLRRRLERARQLSVSKTGEPVSTSEIAKQFLESARDDRLEVVDLLADATESLLQIRRKGDAGIGLTRAEWTVLAHFVKQGVEAASSYTPNPVSRDGLIAVLDAFLAVYSQRRDSEEGLETYYLGNLPVEARSAPAKRGGKAAIVDAEVVRRAVEETRRRGQDLSTPWQPVHVARNLYVLLEGDRLPGAADLNQALRPFWPPLWRLAARGHYADRKRPVREPVVEREAAYQPPIPSITEGEFTLHFARGAGSEFSVLFGLPPSRGVRYPVSGYPRLNEFRAMVTALGGERGADHWNAAHFIGGLSDAQVGSERTVWFRAHDNGITLLFSLHEWSVLQRLFRRAWDAPDIVRAWDALAMEYGDL